MKLTISIMTRGLYSIFSRQTLIALPLLIFIASCTNLGTQSSLESTTERRGGSKGYIPVENLPNTLAFALRL